MKILIFKKKRRKQAAAIYSPSRKPCHGKNVASATIGQLGPLPCLLRRTIFPGWTLYFGMVLPS